MNKNTFNRFGITGWLFMLGFTISSFVLLNISDVIGRIQKEEIGINKFDYSEKYWITPTNNENFHLRAPELTMKVISAMQDVSCNASFYELSVNAERQIDYHFVELVMNNSGNQKLISHHKMPINVNFPKDSNVVVIGESIISITENGEGQLLNLNDIVVPVADILKNDSPSKIDNSIYAFWDCADEKFRKYLISRITERLSSLVLQVHFYGDDPIRDDVQSFTEAMLELGLYCEPVESYMGLGYEGKDAENLWYRAYNFIILPICTVFAVFTCFSTSYVWLLSRAKEIAIRKAYGYSNIQMLFLIIKDEIMLGIPSIFGAMIIEFFFCFFTKNLDFFDSLFVLKVVFVCMGMLTISVLCAIRQFKTISTISSAAALKDN